MQKMASDTGDDGESAVDNDISREILRIRRASGKKIPTT